jgi:hypothetical protein
MGFSCEDRSDFNVVSLKAECEFYNKNYFHETLLPMTYLYFGSSFVAVAPNAGLLPQLVLLVPIVCEKLQFAPFRHLPC